MAVCFALGKLKSKEIESQRSSFLNTLMYRPASFFTLSILQSKDNQSKTTAIAAVPQRGRLPVGNLLEPEIKQLMPDLYSDKHTYTKKTAPALFSQIYRIGQTIGIGGFSEVKLGENLMSGDRVAVKIINRKKFFPKTGESFEKEIELFEKIQHPNCIELKEWFCTKKAIYLVTEIATGGDLLDRVVKRRYFTEKDAARTITQILTGLAYLHSIGVIHGDLKLENLLLASDENKSTIKIADFSLSKIFSGTQGLCTMCGSPQYVAPEVLLARENKVTLYTTPSDLWSVGVILYILLSGFSPFQDKNESIMYDKIKTGRYSFKHPAWKNISQSAKDMVEQLLCVDPDRRLNAKQALSHPWLRVNCTCKSPMDLK